MRKNKCKHDKRECKIEGCNSTEFFDTCHNMCKKHRAEYCLAMYHKRKRKSNKELMLSLVPKSPTIAPTRTNSKGLPRLN